MAMLTIIMMKMTNFAMMMEMKMIKMNDVYDNEW